MIISIRTGSADSSDYHQDVQCRLGKWPLIVNICGEFSETYLFMGETINAMLVPQGFNRLTPGRFSCRRIEAAKVMKDHQVEKKLQEKQEAAKASPVDCSWRGLMPVFIPKTWQVVDIGRYW
jgi:hypothetical protein